MLPWGSPAPDHPGSWDRAWVMVTRCFLALDSKTLAVETWASDSLHICFFQALGTVDHWESSGYPRSRAPKGSANVLCQYYFVFNCILINLPYKETCRNILTIVKITSTQYDSIRKCATRFWLFLIVPRPCGTSGLSQHRCWQPTCNQSEAMWLYRYPPRYR